MTIKYCFIKTIKEDNGKCAYRCTVAMCILYEILIDRLAHNSKGVSKDVFKSLADMV